MLLVYLTLFVCDLKVYQLEQQHDKVPYYVQQHNADIQPVHAAQMRYLQPQNDHHATVNKEDNLRRFREARTFEESKNNHKEIPSAELDSNKDRDYRRRHQNLSDFRRYLHQESRLFQKRMYHSSRSDSEIVTSSSEDTNEFKENWQKRWNELKLDALNPTNNITLQANNMQRFAMVAARPWYKPCGDPAQHDLPWGTCTLPYECEGEYRIYRGDSDCGRTSLVCCAVESFRHDMNAAFDVSFADTSMFSTSSEEVKKLERGSKENRHRKRVLQRNRIKKQRYRQKRHIKKLIIRLVRQIRKQLNRAFRNNTHKRATAQTNLKIYVDTLKKKFKKHRKEAMDNRTSDVNLLFSQLDKKLDKVLDVNRAFLTNATFRELVVKGTNKRLLSPASRQAKERNKTRRSDNGNRTYKSDIYLQYDI